jgi:hypothetical protein
VSGTNGVPDPRNNSAPSAMGMRAGRSQIAFGKRNWANHEAGRAGRVGATLDS